MTMMPHWLLYMEYSQGSTSTLPLIYTQIACVKWICHETPCVICEVLKTHFILGFRLEGLPQLLSVLKL